MRVIKATVTSFLILGFVVVNQGNMNTTVHKDQDLKLSINTCVHNPKIHTDLKLNHIGNTPHNNIISYLQKDLAMLSRNPGNDCSKSIDNKDYFLREGNTKGIQANNIDFTSGSGSLKRFLY